MKRILLRIIVLLTILCSVSFVCFAADGYDTDSYIEDAENELFSVIDSDTRDVLEKFGIDSLDYSKIYDASLSSIGDYFATDLRQKAGSTVKSFMLLLSALLIISAVGILCGFSEKDSMLKLLSVGAVSLITVGGLQEVINTVISVLSLSADFLKAYIPIFAGIVAFSGNPSSALTYNSLTLAFAQGLSAFSDGFAVNLIGAFFCLSIAFSMNGEINISRYLNAFSKVFSTVLGLAASSFTGLLCVKGSLSASIDSASVKSVRYLISSVIPVVGSSISEAYSSIIASIGLIKGSVAAIGIFCSLIINIPALSQALLYFLSMNILSLVADMLNLAGISSLFRCFACGIKFLLLLLVFEMFLLIISTGLMLNFKGGA